MQHSLTARNSNKIRNMGILCAFLVVVIHCRPKFETGTFAWWIKEFLENGVTHIAVPFFFVVSGFMVASELNSGDGGEGYKSALRKRLRSLLVPFFFWNLAFYAFNVAMFNLANLIHGRSLDVLMPSLKDLGIWYTGCPMLTPLWYVRALLILCLLSPLLLWLLRKMGMAFLIALIVIYGIFCPFVPLPDWAIFKHYAIARVGILPVLGFFYFVLGMAIRDGIVFFKQVRLNPLMSLLIGMTIVVIRAFSVYNGFEYSHYLGFISIPFTLYGVWGLVSDRKLPSWLVMSSFGIYVSHKFVLALIKPFINTNGNAVCYLGVAGLAFAMSLSVVVILKKLFPRFSSIIFGGR